jgi:trehalose 6-phosphate synthase/phosphatase
MKKPGSFRELSRLSVNRIRCSEKRLFLLDFDGTLVDIASEVAVAVPSDDILNLLNRLADIQGNRIVIITGRSRETIEHLFRNMNIDMVAEHGAILRERGTWKNLSGNNTEWKEKIFPVMEKFNLLLPGSNIENKKFSVAWHYRNAGRRQGIIISKALSGEMNNHAVLSGLTVIHGKKVIEIMSNEINKGLAVKYLTNKNHYDFILSIGDDTTDEDMFRPLTDDLDAFTVRIGSSDTEAKFRMSSLRQVQKLLSRLIEVCEEGRVNQTKTN